MGSHGHSSWYGKLPTSCGYTRTIPSISDMELTPKATKPGQRKATSSGSLLRAPSPSPFWLISFASLESTSTDSARVLRRRKMTRKRRHERPTPFTEGTALKESHSLLKSH